MYLAFFVLLNTKGDNIGFHIVNECIRLAFLIPAVYINIYYLIPQFFGKKQFLRYLIAVLFLVALVTPLQMLVLHLRFDFVADSQAYHQALNENRYWLLLFNFVVISASTFVQIVTDWIRQDRRVDELSKETMQSELRFLKSQINPHFLFNTLNNLYALTLKKSDKAPEIVLKLSEMMRYMLYECNEPRVRLRQELTYLSNYLDLEQIRQGDKSEILIEVEGDVREQRIAPLIFLTFVENCFKHGLGSRTAEGYVRIFISVDGNNLKADISNNKIEIPQESPRRSGGIGLVNVKRRLELNYPNKYSLDIQDKPNEYRVILTLNLDT